MLLKPRFEVQGISSIPLWKKSSSVKLVWLCLSFLKVVHAVCDFVR